MEEENALYRILQVVHRFSHVPFYMIRIGWGKRIQPPDLCVGGEETGPPEVGMGIAFSVNQWDRVRDAYGAWWADRLDRPILPAAIENRDPGRICPAAPVLSQATCADLSIPAEALIDRLDYELSKLSFVGDAYPLISFDSFGPGLAAAFLGARLDNSTGRVWFHPDKLVPVSELRPAYNPDNIWLQRIRDIYRPCSTSS